MSNCCNSLNKIAVAMNSSVELVNANSELPVAIIGGGPVGLAAAAHLVSQGQRFILFESAHQVGGNVTTWSHVRLFSPWKYNIDKAAKQLLEVSGWTAPDDEELPTGSQLLEQYLIPLSNLPEIQPYFHLNTKVTAVSRKGLSKIKTAGRNNLPFVLHILENDIHTVVEARAVIDASGTWGSPNPAVSDGNWTDSELKIQHKMFYGIPDVLNEYRTRYAGKHVLVVGSGHSAINALLALESLQQLEPLTRVTWILRKESVSEVYGGQENDALAARGALGTQLYKFIASGKLQVFSSFQIEKFQYAADQITIYGMHHGQEIRVNSVDEVIISAGSRPNLSFLREIRLDMDNAIESVRALAPLIDPNIHSCGTVRPHGERELRQPESNFYIVGAKSYGRAPTFLLTTGYEQVRCITAALVGDYEAADKVELVLPETGVCSSSKSIN
ncbi:NAD(P)-binding domain-containing protein [Paenibacillus sp. PDC88]|uniref:NAD(P)-binding domain-containing protein n=1 Tax=Paenibacillus sp. PDC88 TaxID=1884375 RepID=UPI0008981F76|nr:NAD(P)-binding domain-containing protein [Paenibacillus sp. PDC88]SDW73880.1 Pyridine nucleotide-disulphide oxidoreductase [Paenibacillus sp. PDC88]